MSVKDNVGITENKEKAGRVNRNTPIGERRDIFGIRWLRAGIR